MEVVPDITEWYDHIELLEYGDRVEGWRPVHRNEPISRAITQPSIVLIHDSCHAILPNLAQGVNSPTDGAVIGLPLSSQHFAEVPQPLNVLPLFHSLLRQEIKILRENTQATPESRHPR